MALRIQLCVCVFFGEGGAQCETLVLIMELIMRD